MRRRSAFPFRSCNFKPSLRSLLLLFGTGASLCAAAQQLLAARECQFRRIFNGQPKYLKKNSYSVFQYKKAAIAAVFFTMTRLKKLSILLLPFYALFSRRLFTNITMQSSCCCCSKVNKLKISNKKVQLSKFSLLLTLCFENTQNTLSAANVTSKTSYN